MIIKYYDEFDEFLYEEGHIEFVPRTGEVVWIADAYLVSNVIRYPGRAYIKVQLEPWTESVGKINESFENPDVTSRLDDMRRAILNINKKQETTEKKGRALTESVVSLRKSLNQSIQRENKKNDTR
jgi:hypothetical protein